MDCDSITEEKESVDSPSKMIDGMPSATKIHLISLMQNEENLGNSE